ncbi:MAG: hypothetical protein JW395_2833 [Nitrospira sp.]|nr:hypothetical protein [Nitrospira sp.]
MILAGSEHIAGGEREGEPFPVLRSAPLVGDLLGSAGIVYGDYCSIAGLVITPLCIRGRAKGMCLEPLCEILVRLAPETERFLALVRIVELVIARHVAV